MLTTLYGISCVRNNGCHVAAEHLEQEELEIKKSAVELRTIATGFSSLLRNEIHGPSVHKPVLVRANLTLFILHYMRLPVC